jgi:lipid A 3-O-deacylase
MGTASITSDTTKTRDVLSLGLGILGPWAGGQNIQNGFHRLIGHETVKGWDYQIANTPAAEVLAARTWRLPLGSIGVLETDVLPSMTAVAGNLRDYAQAGATLRLGQGLTSDFGVPRLQPGLSGGNAYTPTRPVAWYGFVGVDGQAIAYDTLLQAAPFRSGSHVTAHWDVAEFQAGLAVMVWGSRLTVAYVAQTKEFYGQAGGLHQFASVSLSFRF